MKITVAIPTVAGREKYLASSLATCVAQDDAALDILVSDNSQGTAESTVRGIGDPRVRYVRPPAFLPMSAHWDFMLGHVQGEAVTIIGDDDGLMPGAIANVRRIHAAHGNVPIHHPLANFCWPDHPDASRRANIQFMHDPIVEEGWRDSGKYLDGLASGARVYLDGPMIYHNFLPMPLVRQIAENGRFFRRPIPDVWSAIAVAKHSPRFYESAAMLTLAGQGARSNGALVNAGGSDGSTFAAPPAPDPLLEPRFASRSVNMLTLDSMIEAGLQPDVGGFLLRALQEARQMATGEARRREYMAVLKAAQQLGASTALINKLGSRALARLKPVPHAAASTPADLPCPVANILEATGFLATWLAAKR